MLKSSFRILVSIILVAILSATGITSVYSQANVRTVSITNIDTATFPDVLVSTRIKDATNSPVMMLTAQDFQVTEDRNPVEFSLERTRVGLNMVMVLDFNAGITSTGGTGGSRLDESKWIAQRYIDKMTAGDQMAVVVVRPDGTFLLQEFSQDKEQLSKAVQELKATTNTQMSFTLDGVELAIEKLKDIADEKRDKAVLLVSPGILTAKGSGINSGLVDIGRSLNNTDITLNTVLVRNSNQAYWLDQLAAVGSGQYAHFTNQAGIDALLEQIEIRAWQYVFKFRSKSGLSGDRLLAIGLAGSDTPITTTSYSVQPPPAAPRVTSIVINNGDPILRSIIVGDAKAASSLDETNVSVSISWPDGHARWLERAELRVNNQQVGLPVSNPENNFSLVWDLRSFNELGTSTALVEVLVYDELGLSASQQVQIPVEVTASSYGSSSGLCSSMAKIPGIGMWMSRTCLNMGLTASQLINFIILIVVLILIAVLWFNRSVVSKAAGEVGVRMTELYENVTVRFKKSDGRQAKAVLVGIQGIDGGERNQFDLYGETSIGRSREHCVLVFANYPAISREHAVIHENKSNGQWTIEDRDSANGTFLNGKQLEPFDKFIPLKHGDVIELAEVQRGGLKFRFELPDNGGSDDVPSKNSRKPATPKKGDETMSDDDELRSTHRFPVEKPSKNMREKPERVSARPVEDDDDIDPSQQTF